MGILKFRPSARIIHTIGDDIIKDVYAALIELVKNSYDADAKKVSISFSDFVDSEKAKIVIKDDGHGMKLEDVTGKWLIPGTDNKSNITGTPLGRIIQGHKGIGRFAASILGDKFILKTTCEGITTSLEIDWEKFNSKKFLDEVEIEIKSEFTGFPNETQITIFPREKVTDWDQESFKQLSRELSKMLSPSEVKHENFRIFLKCSNIGINEFNSFDEEIKPLSLLDSFDYRLYGTIDEQGNMDLIYINNIEQGLAPEKVFHRFSGDLCAPITVDFKVFDRDPEAIDSIIKRGSLSLDRIETRRLLDNICGINIFRGGFRIRPYGDPGYDWVGLDKKRVQDPSRKIGANQIVGAIEIKNEERSRLVEKSARDGLREDKNYFVLLRAVSAAITILAEKRYDFRYKTGRGRKAKNISEELDTLFDFRKIKASVKTELEKSNVSEETAIKIQGIINTEEKEKIKALENIKEIIAMYQGQITVGKIVSVLMHEGRKPLKYLKEESPRISDWIDEIQKNMDPSLLAKITDRLIGAREQALILIDLFDRLSPLAAKKRGKKQEINVIKIIERVHQLFNTELQENHINVSTNIDKDISFLGWEQDLYIALTNLFDNSIYWLSQKRVDRERTISIASKREDSIVILDFIDNGPGIDQEYIEKEIIFEPGFSTKPEGTGLGLAISGEAIERNGGKLKAIFNPEGAHLRIELPVAK